MEDRLKDKVALITGAAAGIGEASALRFAREGATVMLLDRDEAGAARVAEAVGAAGGRAQAMHCDVTSPDDCRRAVEWALEQAGRIDVLFNVAGVVHGGTLLQATAEQMRTAFEVNVMGMFYLCQLVVPGMLKQGKGSVINVGSVAGPFAVPNRGVYSTTKAAVLGLTKSLAMDHVGQGVRVNAICPGTVETPSWHDRVNQAPDPKKMLEEFIARQPMGRVGQPEEIAALAAFLASDESAYMTGQALYMDGGMTM